MLKLGAVGVAGLFPLDLLAACGGSEAAQPALDPKSLTAFQTGRVTGKPTGLAARVGWASTADSEFFLAVGRGMQQAATNRGVEYRHGNVGE